MRIIKEGSSVVWRVNCKYCGAVYEVELNEVYKEAGSERRWYYCPCCKMKNMFADEAILIPREKESSFFPKLKKMRDY